MVVSVGDTSGQTTQSNHNYSRHHPQILAHVSRHPWPQCEDGPRPANTESFEAQSMDGLVFVNDWGSPLVNRRKVDGKSDC